MAVGKAVYGPSFVKKNAWKVEEGDNFYRLLPPIKSLAEKGIWAVYERVHWGITNSEGKKRVFKCIEKKGKDKMVKVRCPMCDLIAVNKNERDGKAAEMAKSGMSVDQINGKLKYLDEWLQNFNLDSKWYVNAMNAKGEIGRLAFAHSYKKDLDLCIDKLVNPPKGRQVIDPIDSAEGVIFNFFYMKGNQKTRVQKVTVFKEEITMSNGEVGEVTKRAPLTENVLNRLDAEAWDLVGMYKELAPTDIERLVNCKFDPELVDALFSNGQVQASTAASGDEPEPEEESAPLPKTTTAPATQAQAEVSTPAAVATKSATNQPISDGDFFARFGNKSA